MIKEKDFVEIDYEGRITGTTAVFDLTDEAKAKKLKIHQKTSLYGPKIFCVGKNYLLAKLETSLVGKKEGDEYEVDLTSEESFGKKLPELIRTIATSEFLKQKIQPYPGLQVTLMGRNGLIKSVSRGRTLVDFNHPLAGRNVTYKIKVLSIVKDDEKKLKGLIQTLLNIKEPKIENKEGTFKINEKIAKPIQDTFLKELKETIPSIKASF
jgi:peptidylprolyl isomerase